MKKNVLVTIDGKRYKMSFKDYIRLVNSRFNYYVTFFKDSNKIGLQKTKILVDKYNTTNSNITLPLTNEDIDSILTGKLMLRGMLIL